ncbi:MAG: DUF1385 domain-containing protein [Ignavibacteriales bacterium]|nr:DUF1385 domain-containing protein [Ignavibacteriales bacterium]
MAKTEETRQWIPVNPAFDPSEPMQVGGQAVIEGVMMRAKGVIATAVRRKNGEIVVKKEAFRSIAEKYPILKTPVIRGAVGLVEMLYVGIRTLNYSAEIAMEDELGALADKKKPQTAFALAMTLIVALAAGIGLFFFLPLFAATHLFSFEQQPVLFNLVAGTIRILILLAYLSGISLMEDVATLFRYHGAEHKAVFTFELNAPLTVPCALGYSRFHPRCGTSFILIVALISIALFSVLDAGLLLLLGSLTLPIRLMTHIPFIPVVGGIAYEVLKFSARKSATLWGRMMIAPGLWLQKITTKEPDEQQMEVALAAIQAALSGE